MWCISQKNCVCCLTHQAITWTNVDLSPMRSRINHLRAISQELLQPSITKIILKIDYPNFILVSNMPLSSWGYSDILCSLYSCNDHWVKAVGCQWKLSKHWLSCMNNKNTFDLHNCRYGPLFDTNSRLMALLYPDTILKLCIIFINIYIYITMIPRFDWREKWT